VDRFTRALAVQLRTSTAAMTDEQLALLLSPVSRRNPYIVRHDAVGVANIIDINVGDNCNLFCTFCTDVAGRGRVLYRPTEFWRDELDRAYEAGKRGVLISGNEPTLRPDIPQIAAEAKRLGYVEIELSTAGVRLADRAYLSELLDAGVNVLATSIHGSTPEVDGQQTGRLEFFAPRLRGFENFVDLVGGRKAQEERGIFLKTISIFTRQNLADIPALVAFLDGLEVSYALLYYPWIKGDALHKFDEIVPDYDSVAAAIAPISARLRDPASFVQLANLPPCVTPEHQRGRTAVKSIVRLSGAKAGEGRDVLRVFAPTDPTLMHPEPCNACDARASCGGVPKPYVERFGTLGLRPIPPAA
jgi:molybdenum cofactor biosynthesis enzyme MoaA